MRAWLVVATTIAGLFPRAPLDGPRICLAKRDPPSSGGGILSRFEEEYSHLHVHPSAHRSTSSREANPPVLAFTFAIRAAAQVLQFTLPPGYILAQDHARVPGECAAFASGSHEGSTAYSSMMRAKPLDVNVNSCDVGKFVSTNADGKADQRARLTVRLKDGIPGLSAARSSAEGDGLSLSWWFFHLPAWLPLESPAVEENVFELHWAPENASEWEGSTAFEGWPVLGDWDCAYSDWEGWGPCSAQCGSGVQRLTRRVLVEPPKTDLTPGHGTPESRNCTGELVRDVLCNEHLCHHPVEEILEEDRHHKSRCSAVCGGGLKISRRMWRGDNGPAVEDLGALVREHCNTQPCRPSCRLSDTWTVATECSALCGMGHFMMVRVVVQKDEHDADCQPEWRSMPCVRQHCYPLTVLRLDRNLLPYPNDKFRVGVVFKLPITVRKIQLHAPENAEFGQLGDRVQLYDHSLMPHLESCKVGQRLNEVELSFRTPLPATSHDDDQGYQFLIEVTNPGCDSQRLLLDPLNTTARCDISPDRNRWTLEFAQEGSNMWESLSAEGYDLFKLVATESIKTAELLQFLRLEQQAIAGKTTTTSTQASFATLLDVGGTRPRFCSPRFACEDGDVCLDSGICVKNKTKNE